VRKAQNGQSPSDLVDSVIQEALARHASDVHLEPNESGLLVRFRVHGLLQTAMLIPGSDKAAVTSRIKIMANLDIAEHRLPQDGRIRLRQNGHAVDARVSTVPSLHGEKVVLRLLDLDGIAIPLDNIGLRPAHLEELRRLIRKPQGIIFVTGPTGSGKTSTIYAALNEIKSETINIITIEDPIEYEIAGITQIAIHDKIGRSFANCLRSVLRQDPDVLLVGEVRDQETARIAMQASLTGHLVFATLHTNNAVARASEAELRQCLSGGCADDVPRRPDEGPRRPGGLRRARARDGAGSGVARRPRRPRRPGAAGALAPLADDRPAELSRTTTHRGAPGASRRPRRGPGRRTPSRRARAPRPG
jgi:type II secretory ATPase GspE/PulE/Tfp pilus assembly ATPase PilB-like protein